MTLRPDVSQHGQYWVALASTTNEKVKSVVCKERTQAQIILLSRSMGTTFKDTDVVLSLLAETIHHQKDFTNTPKFQLVICGLFSF